MRMYRIFFFVFFYLVGVSLFAQEYDFSETIEVSKVYKPVVLDAEKIETVPSLDWEAKEKKKEVPYQMISYPEVAKFQLSPVVFRDYIYRDSVHTLENYLDLSMANNLTPLGRAFFSHIFSNNTTIGIDHRTHFSKYGGGRYSHRVLDDFLNVKTRIFFEHTFSKAYRLKWDAWHRMKTFHYYGLPSDSIPLRLGEGVAGDISTFNLEQNTQTFQGRVLFKNQNARDKVRGLDEIEVKFRWSKDAYQSYEKRMDFGVGFFISRYFGIGFRAFGVATDFDEKFDVGSERSFNNLGGEVPLKIYITGKDYEIHIGGKARVGYSFGDTTSFRSSAVKYFFMPDIHLTYDIASDLLRIKLAIVGSYTANTYHSLSQVNPFLYPNQNLKDTYTPLNLKLGLVGRFSSSLSYGLEAGYANTLRAVSFARIRNATRRDRPIDTQHPYKNSNAFYVFYDDLETYSVSAVSEYESPNGLKMGVYVSFSKYYSKAYTQAYDRPELDFNFLVSYRYADWVMSSNARYVGERFVAFRAPQGVENKLEHTTVSPYIDINMKLEYQLNDYMGMYLKGTNLLNKTYEKWKDYPVQGVMGFFGVVVKF